jgi:xanthine dehydrogenase accessory factor
MIKGALADHVQHLVEERTPFVIATVVRARHPTSVRPGDSAVVLADGTIEGFVGGVCAESSVRLYSLRALETGEAVLLRLVPGDGVAEGEDGIEGAVVEHNPCLSGGSLEIFLEPQLPAARLVIAGAAPIAGALARVAAAAGYEIAAGSGAEAPPIEGAAAVVVASHGADEEHVLADALTAGIPYVALVASSRRGEAVRESLEVPAELQAQLHTPAGLELGAGTPDEIAVAILAEIIAERHAHPVPSVGAGATAVASAIDPVCGMEVAVTEATVRLDLDGERMYFCSGGCRDAYAAEHAAS